MDVDEDVNVLSQSALFRQVDRSQLRLLALMSEMRTFFHGEALMHQDEEGDSAFVLLSGEVAVLVSVEGVATQVATLGATEIVGEMALLTDSRRTATVRAQGEVKALRLERGTLTRFLSEFPEMTLELLRVITKRLEQTTRELGRAKAALNA